MKGTKLKVKEFDWEAIQQEIDKNTSKLIWDKNAIRFLEMSFPKADLSFIKDTLKDKFNLEVSIKQIRNKANGIGLKRI